jgi:hypothetical protein
MFAFTVSLCSCSFDDDNSSSNMNPEGTRQLTAICIKTAFDFNNDGTASRNLFEETSCYDADFAIFDSEGVPSVVGALTYISVQVNSPTDYKYVYECLDGFDVESTYTQDGNKVTILFSATTLEGIISGKTMTVTIPDFFEIEMYNGTEYFEVQEDTVLVYVKS